MRILAILFILIQVSGCTSYNSKFECSAEKGIGCKSISQVNDMINNGEINGEELHVRIKEQDANTELAYNNLSIQIKGIKRVPERIARIWINGFTDEKGDYVGETYIYTVLTPGKWEEI